MRVLFSATAGDGHFYPLLPLAQALRAQGDDVAFAMSPEYTQRLEAAGFSWFASGVDTAELSARLVSKLSELPHHRSPDYMPFIISQRYAVGDAPDRLADLLAICTTWKPDLIVFESCDLAGPIAAAALGIAGVHHSFGRALAAECYQRSAPYLQPLWQKVGCDMPPLCGMYAGSFVDLCPPSLQSQGVPVTATVYPLRTNAGSADTPPDWLRKLPDRPSVYVTLGTIFNDVKRLRLLLEAFAHEDVNVVMTTGRDRDPIELGPHPANASVHQFVPQDLLLPHMQALVTHAGSGSMLAALSHGVPMVMLPLGADQFDNATACHALDLARILPPEELNVDRAREELSTVLLTPNYAHNAEKMAREISAMPDSGKVAEEIRNSGGWGSAGKRSATQSTGELGRRVQQQEAAQ